MTETYVALKCFVGKLAWAAWLLSAHRESAPHRAAMIACNSRHPAILFNANAQQPQPPNVLALRIQPGGLSLRIVSRVPGTRAQTHPWKWTFNTGGLRPPSPKL